MKQKDTSDSGDSLASVSMTTPVGKQGDADVEITGVVKGKKLGIKRVKKKPDMNISKGKLKSVTTPKNFSFLNMSVQKQTLRANNRALAQNLAKARQEIQHLKTEVQTLRSSNQEYILELNRLKRLVGIKDEQIQVEVQQRIQEEMKEMRKLLDGLTHSMMNSSTFINKMHDKCLMYCSRRSTDSTRSSSLGNNQSFNRSSSRASFKEIVSKDDLMAKYLSKADEFTAPPGGSIFNNYNHESDMSLIAEQSMTDEEFYTAKPLVSVDETIAEISPIEAAPAQPLSKLPQRVLKYSDPKAVSVNTAVSSQEISSEKSKSDMTQKELKGKQSAVKEKDMTSKEKEKLSSKSSKQNEEMTRKEKESGKIKDKKDLKKKGKEHESEAAVVIDSKVKRMEEDKAHDGKDNNMDGDISAFGFGGNFAADLVSGSPISTEKRRETFVLPKTSVVSNVESKAKENKEKESSSKTEVILKTSAKGNKHFDKGTSVKNSSKVNREISAPKFVKSASKIRRRDTYATENPFIPKSTNIQRSPQKLLNEEGMAFDTVENPFKPTKTLLRSPVHSPVHIIVESASPEKKVDSLAFLARFRESLEQRPEESSPLPEPIFPDEPTTYFNSEMEFTSVIDSTKLLQTLRRPEKNSPVSQMESIRDSEDQPVSVIDKSASKSANYNDNKSQHESVETAAVEVRTKKPGVFTFSVGRKEADGSRKPVPEKVSKARSKKKKPVTPEKEERKTGADRDMFNFGDRTPTMPLEKLAAKTKDVYDLSMNESVAAAPMSFNNFKEKKSVPESVSDGQIYYAPLKSGSPDEKSSSKRARSQLRSRSKSRKKDEDDDDDWVPGGKSRGRSKSRSRKADVEQTAVRRGRSQSRKRVADETECAEKEEIKPRGRSKSRNDKTEKDEVTERSSRSRSCGRVIKPDKNDDDLEQEEKEPISRRCRSKSRGRALKDVSNDKEESGQNKAETEFEANSMEKIENRSCRSKTKQDDFENEGEGDVKEVRRGRSRSRARSKIHVTKLDDNELNNEKSEHTDKELVKTSPPPRRSARSKLQIKKPLYDEDSDDENLVLQRKSRSRSMKGRKTFEIKHDDTDNELDKKSEKLADVEKYEKRCNTVVLDSDENDSSTKEDKEHYRKVSDDEVVIQESESESEKVAEIGKSRSRRRIKSINYDDDVDDFDDNNLKNNSERKSRSKKSAGEKVREDNLEEKIGRHLDFINKRRGKSLKITDDDDAESKVACTDDKLEKVISNNSNYDEIVPDSPVVNRKLEERKPAKSTKKSTKKRKAAEPEKTGKSRLNIADKLDNEEIKLSKTPATLQESVKKSSKSSVRSTKKAKVEHLPEQTPILTEEKSKSQISEQPSAIALLKKRLTMVGNKHLVKEDTNTEVRKRSQAEIGGQQKDDCGSPEKRTKRNKNPVSYVTKPLNVKLRRGDDMFQDTAAALSKVKAEQSRLLIAKKTSVPKISVDDKENVMQSLTTA